MRASFSTAIEIGQNITSQAFTLANATQLQQIMMNLCTNAAHAMRNQGGILDVTLTDTVIDLSSAGQNIDLPLGRDLLLAVSYTGCGMGPEVVQKMFAPYFTTKSKGESSGLGMAVVHGIVRRYRGAINVYSLEGKRTTVKVYLIRQADTNAEFQKLPMPLPTGTETVLLVGDDSQLAAIEQQMLTRRGYQVTTCEDSDQALEVFRAQPEAFAAVTTDMSMPKMNGVEFARALMPSARKCPSLSAPGIGLISPGKKR